MVKLQHFIGIDISKNKVDVALVNAEAPETAIFNQSFSNNNAGCKALVKELKKHHLSPSDLLVCMEFTGVYSRAFAHQLVAASFAVWLEMPYKIKHSSGLKREKTDKADALSIAQYCARFKDKARLYQGQEEVFEKLQTMLNYRDGLVSKKIALAKAVKELKSVGLKNDAQLIEKASKLAIAGLDKAIKSLENEIDLFVKQCPSIQDQLKLLLSIPSVGKITALTFIAVTKGFTKTTSSKTLACYSGIAPFQKTSGSSIRGKTRVSKMANRRLKTLLHLCAMRLLQIQGHFRDYYLRKLEEGKNKMLIINAIRNKIVQRMFSVIKNQRLYSENLVLS